MADQMTNEVIDQETAEAQMVEVVQPAIEKLIYVIRDKQVMIDSDLAMLYHVETKRLNEAVKRNIARFPEEFRFQLTEKETESLRSQIATSMKSNGDNEKKGGRRYLPYAFTDMQEHVLPYLQSFCSMEERAPGASDQSVNISKSEMESGKITMSGQNKRTKTVETGKKSIHERLQINKEIISKQQGKISKEKGVELMKE